MKIPMLYCALLLVVFPAANAETFLVNPDGSGDYPTIQTAIDAAANGYFILLGDGVFTGSGNRDLIVSHKALTLKSLNSNPEACVIDSQGSAGYNHFALIFQGDNSQGSTIEGIKFINGYASHGGALSIGEGASCTVRSCVFQSNYSLGDGGAVFSSVNLDASSADGCTSDARTGFSSAMAASRFSLVIEDCLFLDNEAYYSIGGSAVFASDCHVELHRCEFIGNAETAVTLQYTTGALADCRFQENGRSGI